jgi:hypothetical protein
LETVFINEPVPSQDIVSSRHKNLPGIKCGSGTLTQTSACHTNNLHGILYSQYNNTHPNWCQQETDNNNIATMTMAVFVTKQQTTVNIIISITQIVLTIVDDAVLSWLIVILLLKGTTWLNMVST